MGGILGDSFGKLWDVIWSAIKWVGNIIWSAIQWVANIIWSAAKWMIDALAKFFQKLIDVIDGTFGAIYDIIDGFLYLLYKIGVLAVKLFIVLFETAKLLWSLIVGFVRTLASLSYTPQGGSGTGYSSMLGKLFTNLNVLQIDVVAYILLFCLWFTTAIMAIKLLSSIRVGGD